MAVWYPDSSVSQKELLGRRLIDSSSDERSVKPDRKPKLKVDDFYDKRLELDLSVDRLGNPNPSRDTLKLITKLADDEAKRRDGQYVFNGWATIRVTNLRFRGWTPVIKVMPTRADDGSIENYWHAEISRDGFRGKAQAYTFAVTLQQTFERNGSYHSPRRS